MYIHTYMYVYICPCPHTEVYIHTCKYIYTGIPTYMSAIPHTQGRGDWQDEGSIFSFSLSNVFIHLFWAVF